MLLALYEGMLDLLKLLEEADSGISATYRKWQKNLQISRSPCLQQFGYLLILDLIMLLPLLYGYF